MFEQQKQITEKKHGNNNERTYKYITKSRRNIQREIRRGMVKHETSLKKTNFKRNADYTQQKVKYEMTAKTRKK